MHLPCSGQHRRVWDRYGLFADAGADAVLTGNETRCPDLLNCHVQRPLAPGRRLVCAPVCAKKGKQAPAKVGWAAAPLHDHSLA